MQAWASGFFRKNLKAWISGVVLAQCLLVFIYLQATRTGGVASQSRDGVNVMTRSGVNVVTLSGNGASIHSQMRRQESTDGKMNNGTDHVEGLKNIPRATHHRRRHGIDVDRIDIHSRDFDKNSDDDGVGMKMRDIKYEAQILTKQSKSNQQNGDQTNQGSSNADFKVNILDGQPYLKAGSYKNTQKVFIRAIPSANSSKTGERNFKQQYQHNRLNEMSPQNQKYSIPSHIGQLQKDNEIPAEKKTRVIPRETSPNLVSFVRVNSTNRDILLKSGYIKELSHIRKANGKSKEQNPTNVLHDIHRSMAKTKDIDMPNVGNQMFLHNAGKYYPQPQKPRIPSKSSLRTLDYAISPHVHFEPSIEVSNSSELLYNTMKKVDRKSGNNAHGSNKSITRHNTPHKRPEAKEPKQPLPQRTRHRQVDFLQKAMFQLPDPQPTDEAFFANGGEAGCFKEGAIPFQAINTNGNSTLPGFCQCRQEWHGPNCSLPDIFYFSSASGFTRNIKPRQHFRRVINALAFNVEFELLESRLNELDEVVDVFIIFESNYSNYGEPKPLRLLERLQTGYLSEFHHKIVYIVRSYFPAGGKENGWLVDEHMRTFIGQEGLARIGNTLPDDLFLYTDADEFPSRDSLQFLRLHDGYPEPFGLTLRWSVFGFFWKQYEPTRIYVGCSIQMMRQVFQYNAFELRAGDYFAKHSAKIQGYVQDGGNVYEWHLGDNGFLAGWHCSWCMPPSGIQIKLKSAINADFPRWGDYPDKLKLDYIRKLVKDGVWFDDVMTFDSFVTPAGDDFYAPNYMLSHSNRYQLLLNIAAV